MDIDDLIAHEQIRQAMARYARGVDRGDRELILSAYWPGAYDDHGGNAGPVERFAEAIVRKFDATPEVGQHHVTQTLIERDGDRAAVESYVIALNPGTVEAGGAHDLIGGRYLDAFERREGEWRIARRVVVIDVARTGLGGNAWSRDGEFLAGARREADPSAALFTGTGVFGADAPHTAE